jgi:hypothetical protein
LLQVPLAGEIHVCALAARGIDIAAALAATTATQNLRRQIRRIRVRWEFMQSRWLKNQRVNESSNSLMPVAVGEMSGTTMPWQQRQSGSWGPPRTGGHSPSGAHRNQRLVGMQRISGISGAQSSGISVAAGESGR